MNGSSAPARPGTAGVLIGIPSFRRPDRLRRLLGSLEPSLEHHPRASVVVADNGCDAETRAAVEAFAALAADHLPAGAERGITRARNALVDAFLADPTHSEWLAMLDDDLAVPPHWLSAMLAVGEAEDACAVGGPYAYTGAVASFVVRNSIFVTRGRRPTGRCAPFHAAGNILLRRRLLATPPPLRFDHAYGLSGGEDYDFFSRAADRGARFAWCDEAFGDEQVDPARLNARAVAYRYFSTGNYMAHADRARIGLGRSLAGQARLVAAGSALTLLGAVTVAPRQALRGAFYVLIGTGGLLSLAGWRLYRYR